MPPRSRKRKSNRFRKRRPVKRRRTFRRRPVYRRRFRTKVGRRFYRKFRRTRRRSSSSSKTRAKLEFKLTEPRTAEFSYGQQHTVPNSDSQFECVYFMTEFYQSEVKDNRIAVNTVSLGGQEELRRLCEYAWTSVPNDTSGGINSGWTRDNIWGKFFLKGMDTYTLRNQSNETVRITAHVCRCRVNTSRYSGTLNENIYNYMGEGFAEGGQDVGNQAATNAGLTIDNIPIRTSRLFCRTFKIINQYTFKIKPGEYTTRKLYYRWTKHTPADYVRTTPDNVNWTAMERRYAHLKGEKFILFKLHGNIGGITPQTTLMKTIGQTTPTVIMQTQRHYWFKHFPVPNGAALTFVPIGIAGGDTKITVDSDMVQGEEKDSS